MSRFNVSTQQLQEALSQRIALPLSQLQVEVEQQLAKDIRGAGRRLLASAAANANEHLGAMYEAAYRELLAENNNTNGVVHLGQGIAHRGDSPLVDLSVTDAAIEAVDIFRSSSRPYTAVDLNSPKCLQQKPGVQAPQHEPPPPIPFSAGSKNSRHHEDLVKRCTSAPAVVGNAMKFASNLSSASLMTEDSDYIASPSVTRQVSDASGQDNGQAIRQVSGGSTQEPTSFASTNSLLKFRRTVKSLIATHKRTKEGGCGDTLKRSNSKGSSGNDSNISHLDLLPHWEYDPSTPKRSNRLVKCQKSRSSVMLHGTTADLGQQRFRRSGDVIKDDQNVCQFFVFNPTRLPCVFWDILTTCAVLYDLIVIPLTAFQLELVVLDQVCLAVWVMDIFFCFLRGYQNEEMNVVEMRPPYIARRYMRSWLGFDLGIVSLDLLMTWVESGGQLQMFALARVLRLMRLLRLVRILKLSSRVRLLSETLQIENFTEKGSAVWGIICLLIAMLVANHYAACGWYAMGTLDETQHLPQWVHFFDDSPIADSIGYRYVTSFHYSLTQFTPASMSIYPKNVVERLYTLVLIVLGLVMFSSFVSSMTQSMANLQKLNAAQRKADLVVRRYIADNRVSSHLAGSIIGFLRGQKSKKRQKRLHEQDIAEFRALPRQMLHELRQEVYAPVLRSHELFEHIDKTNDGLFQNVGNHAMSGKSLLQSEELFHAGVHAVFMYFVTGGALSYVVMHGDYSHRPQQIKGDRFGLRRISEGALWTNWEHRGRAVGEAHHSDVILLSSEEFAVRSMRSGLVNELQKYAKLYCLKCVRTCKGTENITDIWESEHCVKSIADSAFRKGSDVIEEAARSFATLQVLGLDLRVCFEAWRDEVRRPKTHWLQQCRQCLQCTHLRRKRRKSWDSDPASKNKERREERQISWQADLAPNGESSRDTFDLSRQVNRFSGRSTSTIRTQRTDMSS